MQQALKEAELAYQEGEVPVGAILIDAFGAEIARGHNRREETNDPTAHAEVDVLRKAAWVRKSWRLEGFTVYVTLEPCPMCAGALVNARIARLVYGCSDPKAGAIDTLFQIGKDLRLNHRFEVTQGVYEEESRELLRNFFTERRKKRSLTGA